MPQIQLTLLIGRYAQRRYLGPGVMAEHVRNPARHPRYLALPHPSWRTIGWEAKNPWFGAEILPLLRAAAALLPEARQAAPGRAVMSEIRGIEPGGDGVAPARPFRGGDAEHRGVALAPFTTLSRATRLLAVKPRRRAALIEAALSALHFHTSRR